MNGLSSSNDITLTALTVRKVISFIGQYIDIELQESMYACESRDVEDSTEVKERYFLSRYQYIL
jgi:hypothetical protein